MLQANAEIRDTLRKRNIPLWMIGAAVGVSEQTIIRWFRVELSADKRRMIEKAISTITNEGGIAEWRK